eukprot:390307_1
MQDTDFRYLITRIRELKQMADGRSFKDAPKFLWQIPSLKFEQKLLLAYGYIRQNYNGHMTWPIIHLFANFYSNDSYSLSDIYQAKHKQFLTSNIFSLSSFKFYLELHPNGCNEANEGSVILFLCLASFPPNITTIDMSFKLSLKEINNIFFHHNFKFTSKKYYSGWRRNLLLLKDIKQLTQLTFEAQINIIDIFDKNDYGIIDKFDNEIKPICNEIKR